ncbi:MAG: fucose isomerase [Chloroflexi bacterium AL-W]|nr:fucose isomerase [Chloroflexi bacterium AL-N1]NOK65224.1 fucose isomerase [Chloroflexi bacterium AL-N10]NOK72511.1 fucose isomerase [Chloroflexi bacterium AL-N5]NOK79403.1 fucose isomerase [Chloroflexi bacterium AL-W]NOK87319.1 fucose isomerase [Chloroflexi bacterium AL-N15]
MIKTATTPHLQIALVTIARSTFDVEFAQLMADTVATNLTQANHTLVGTGAELLMDGSAVEDAIATLSSHTFDLVIILQASFADSTMAVQIAEAIRPRGIPLLLWAVPEERSGSRLRLNSLCGINLAGHAFTRHGIDYDYLLAAPDDPTALEKIAILARAGHARRLLRQTRIGLVGQHPVGFETCSYSSETFATLFGAQIVPLPLQHALDRARVASVEQRDAFVQRVAEVADNLNTLDQEGVQGTAGVYVALREYADMEQLDGVAVRCWPEYFTELGCAACGAMSMLNEELTPASCEADIHGTLTLVLLRALSNDHTFITDLVSVDAEDDTATLWHCGLAPISMADPDFPISTTVHSNRRLPLLFEFPLRPGRITIARLSQVHPNQGAAGFQLVVGGGEMVQAPRGFGGTCGTVRFDRPATEVFDTVMREGLEHHFCIVYGDYRAELHAFARLIGLPVVELS